jgi:hypothetical protein
MTLTNTRLRRPTFVVVVETALVVVDEDGRGDMHRVAKQKSFPDAAFPQMRIAAIFLGWSLPKLR